MKRIGIDVGGTFTDVVMVDDSTGKVWSTKVPTTPKDRVLGTVEGFRRILEISGSKSGDISFLGHGTTMATNMVVEGTGAKTALVTTRGFRDILELRRASRHDRADLYDLLFDNPRALVERRWRLEVTERLRFDGSVETALSHEELTQIAARIRDSDVEAVAVCFLHAHVNPEHEMAAVGALREMLPDRFVCASHEVNPEAMEYERTSSTVINAMLGPVCGRYIGRLVDALAQLGFAGKFLFMQSNGGLASPARVADRPIVLLESGPAGGVSAAIRNCERGNLRNAILGDMGGTTFDVYLPLAASASATVLVADDDELVRRAVGEALTEAGYRVLFADSAEAALAVEAGVDIALLDAHLDHRRRSDLGEKLRLRDPRLQVVVMTGLPGPEDYEFADAVLAKPFAFDELRATLARVLNDR